MNLFKNKNSNSTNSIHRKHRRQNRIWTEEAGECGRSDPVDSRTIWTEGWRRCLYQHQIHDPHLRELHILITISNHSLDSENSLFTSSSSLMKGFSLSFSFSSSTLCTITLYTTWLSLFFFMLINSKLLFELLMTILDLLVCWFTSEKLLILET